MLKETYIRIAAGIAGGIIGWIFYCIKYREDMRAQRILRSPKSLVKELQKHGRLVDGGPEGEKMEMKFEVEISPTGKERVILKRIPLSGPTKKIESEIGFPESSASSKSSKGTKRKYKKEP